MQFFKLFPEYQGLPFFPFGESYAGKFVPTIAKKIDAENPTADIKINLAGLGIGDGFMSPPDSSIYGQYLYHVSPKAKVCTFYGCVNKVLKMHIPPVSENTQIYSKAYIFIRG